jgi:arabinofuranosyltransferase
VSKSSHDEAEPSASSEAMEPITSPRPPESTAPTSSTPTSSTPTSSTPPSSTRSRWAAPSLALLAFALCFVNAWVSDDAYITFRVVENVLRGKGVVWNPGERVMVYTHPLWLALLLPTSAVLGVWWASVSLGLAFTAGSLCLYARELASDPWKAALVLGAFALAKSTVHFATSGLETSLLVFLTLTVLLRADRLRLTPRTRDERVSTVRDLRHLALLVAALALTRPDAPLLVLPACVLAFHRTRALRLRTRLRALAPAVALLVALGLVAAFVYGHPLPNTALAKLGHGVPRGELLRQGMAYLASVVAWDPVVVVVIVLALVAGRAHRAWTLGIALHLAYVTWIGGDFMNGRFYLVPFAASLLVLARTPLPGPRVLGPTVVALILLGTVAAERPPFDVLLPNARFGADQSVNGVGVADEQRYYLLATGLFHGAHPPRHVNYRSGTRLRAGDVIVARAIGFLGYGAADRATVIDPIALADPFLARFPAAHDPSWRVGHIRRALPAGYEASVRTGECAMEPALCDAWRDVRLVTRGALFSPERRAALWRVWSGRFDDGVDVERIFVNVEP